MGTQLSWPVATYLKTPRLDLEPVRIDHAEEAYPWLADERIHAFTGGAQVFKVIVPTSLLLKVTGS